MATAQKSKPTSRWGFLSQAVASVESRLDTILGEEEDVPKTSPTPEGVNKENVAPARVSIDSTRSTTNPQSNDRLQERLARAMAKKNAGRADGGTPGSEPTSGRATPVHLEPPSSVQQTNGTVDVSDDSKTAEPTATAQLDAPEAQSGDSRQSEEVLSRLGIPTINAHSRQPSEGDVQAGQHQVSQHSDQEADSDLLRIQLEHESVRSHMQEEINGYIERIDALNAKLQYLAKEAAQSAKDAAMTSDSNSIQKQMHEKDEKIALLLEEGRRLSVAERKNLDIIKKLRSQTALNSKDQEAAKKRVEGAEHQAALLASKMKKVEDTARKAEAQLTTLAKTTADLEAVTEERNAMSQTLIDMKAQIAQANARAESAEIKAQHEKVEIERRKANELQDDLMSARLEHQIVQDKLKREIADLQSSLAREKEQSRAMESEMLAEQASLEGKLESFRVRAEEASSNDQGDSQAKLLRQIETLQGQYATASQNWQGIEGTLLARITSLEKERDDITIREADVRKKLKDAVLKAKTNERNLEEAQTKLVGMEEGQSDTRLEVQQLKRRNQQLENDIARTRQEMDEQKSRIERDFARKLDEERTKWATSIQRVRTESPSNSGRKSSTHIMDNLASPPALDRPFSRKSSALTAALSNIDTHSKHYPSLSVRGLPNGIIPETQSIITSATTEPDEYFPSVPVTPGSHDHAVSRRGLNDLVSTSTVGAGPSVQLVERMSANVRRLENEKAASRDELVRLTTQRDESRQEVVRLMRDVEAKTKTETRLKQLEQEHEALSQRHQTTLELLGEKSELVEELKQDIVDVKDMYRQLADHMK